MRWTVDGAEVSVGTWLTLPWSDDGVGFRTNRKALLAREVTAVFGEEGAPAGTG